MIFSYDQYRSFLAHMKECARVVPFREWDRKPAIILRHDVDFDVLAAHRLAKIEHGSGIRSTFFIRVACETYNPASQSNRGLLREMSSDGFEIGLHFDPSLYGGASSEELYASMDREASFLGFITGEKVRSVSLHNPSVHNEYPLFPGYINAYAPEVFSDDHYLSDSCMNFRGKDPFLFAKEGASHSLQILLHPMHYSEHGKGYPDAIRRYLSNLGATIHAGFQVNSAYRESCSQDCLQGIRGEGAL